MDFGNTMKIFIIRNNQIKILYIYLVDNLFLFCPPKSPLFPAHVSLHTFFYYFVSSISNTGFEALNTVYVADKKNPNQPKPKTPTQWYCKESCIVL